MSVLNLRVYIRSGFWSCCQARPTKVVAFDGEQKGSLVWHYACAGCASTMHPSRVADAPKTDTEPVSESAVVTEGSYVYPDTGYSFYRSLITGE